MNYKSVLVGAGLATSFFLGVAFQASKPTPVAFVETEKVIQQMPEAKTVQSKIQKMGEDWQKEFGDMKKNYEENLQEYERKKVMMSESEKKKKEESIMKLAQKLQEYQSQKLGRGGELEQKQAELFKPLEEKVLKSVEKVAARQGWSIVLSKGGLANPVLYGSKECNITYDVMKEL